MNLRKDHYRNSLQLQQDFTGCADKIALRSGRCPSWHLPLAEAWSAGLSPDPRGPPTLSLGGEKHRRPAGSPTVFGEWPREQILWTHLHKGWGTCPEVVGGSKRFFVRSRSRLAKVSSLHVPTSGRATRNGYRGVFTHPFHCPPERGLKSRVKSLPTAETFGPHALRGLALVRSPDRPRIPPEEGKSQLCPFPPARPPRPDFFSYCSFDTVGVEMV